MWTRELHLFLELLRTSVPAQVPDPALLHWSAHTPSSRPANSRDGCLAAQVVDFVLCVDQAGTSSIFLRLRHMPAWARAAQTELRFILSRLTRLVVRAFARLVGHLSLRASEKRLRARLTASATEKWVVASGFSSFAGLI